MGALSPASTSYLAEMGEEAHVFLSAVWTTTVLTLLLLEGISKGHLVPLGWRVIYKYFISYRYIIFYGTFFSQNLQQ